MTVIYVFLQCTWGLLQTLAGLAVFLVERRQPHSRFRGAVVTRWRGKTSLSLGLFVFVSAQAGGERAARLLVHEYGHTLQSLLLGPLYLLVVGLPSCVWCAAPALIRRRQERGIPYSAFYTERWADRLGESATGQKAL